MLTKRFTGEAMLVHTCRRIDSTVFSLPLSILLLTLSVNICSQVLDQAFTCLQDTAQNFRHWDFGGIQGQLRRIQNGW